MVLQAYKYLCYSSDRFYTFLVNTSYFCFLFPTYASKIYLFFLTSSIIFVSFPPSSFLTFCLWIFYFLRFIDCSYFILYFKFLQSSYFSRHYSSISVKSIVFIAVYLFCKFFNTCCEFLYAMLIFFNYFYNCFNVFPV